MLEGTGMSEKETEAGRSVRFTSHTIVASVSREQAVDPTGTATHCVCVCFWREYIHTEYK